MSVVQPFNFFGLFIMIVTTPALKELCMWAEELSQSFK
jgi:hypothetical protein